jgi:predicted ATP-grasp superfamily ATP-dependent carboligase
MNVLLVATTLTWLGPARLPKALAAAGFTVALLAPRDALAGKSRFVARNEVLPDGATRQQWVDAFAEAVAKAPPRLVIPCDDMAVELLQSLVLAPPPELPSATALRLATLVRDSLGEPRHYRTSIDKTLLPPAAAALGVRVPRFDVVGSLAAAGTFALAHGYPVVLKRAHGAAGEGVAIVAGSAELGPAFARLATATGPLAAGGDGARILIQEFVPGRSLSRTSVAWGGRELAGITRERLTRNPPRVGPGSTLRICCEPEARAFSDALARGLGMQGFFTVDYLVHERTGETHMLEINRRIGTGNHLGAAVGVDPCAALHAAIGGEPVVTPGDVPPGFERIIAQFPQEWMRDPASPWLRDFPADVPWDDPDVFEAMLGLRHIE